MLPITDILSPVSLWAPVAALSSSAALEMLQQAGPGALLGLLAGGGLAWSWSRRTRAVHLVPDHFQTALDGVSEALLVVDVSGRIALCNAAFVQLSGYAREDLAGRKARELFWTWRDAEPVPGAPAESPWLDAVRGGTVRVGQLLGLKSSESRSLVLNASPMLDRRGRPQGAIVSLADVTKLHKKQTELESLLKTVRESAAQIRRQNSQLEEYAVRDPLTGCYNRRTGYEFLEKFWTESQRDREQLAVVMVDVDRLRNVNDQHGHQQADDVLRKVAACLQQGARECDVVCRYGGEEFAVLMPRTALTDAALVAERLRQSIARLPLPESPVTASLGVSASSEEPSSPQALLEQADRCLAEAKRRGRNQVVRHDEYTRQSKSAAGMSRATPDAPTVIPFPAVSALISALAYRDAATAAHSRRVADLCVAVGQRMMSLSSCYVLETAALLHDVGKVGVPDSILLKPTPLSADEWKTMRAHERIGLEIIRSAFGSPELSDIVEHHAEPFELCRQRGQPLPLGARILAVADAYDAMITQQVYRQRMSPADALAELQRCAGTQFDPEIVAQFREVLGARGRDIAPRSDVQLDAARALGMELERLAAAVDRQDLETLQALAGRLAQTASKNGASEVATKGQELERMAGEADDLLGILGCANELLACCRSAQSAYVSGDLLGERSPLRPSETV